MLDFKNDDDIITAFALHFLNLERTLPDTMANTSSRKIGPRLKLLSTVEGQKYFVSGKAYITFLPLATNDTSHKTFQFPIKVNKTQA